METINLINYTIPQVKKNQMKISDIKIQIVNIKNWTIN
jgi:hypothetical protein